MLAIEEQEGYTLIIVLWSIIILTIIFIYLLDDVLINNYLLKGYSQHITIRQAALSGYNIGVNLLLNDKTIYDSEKDPCFQPVHGSIEGVEYSIFIKDTGSKLNINYDEISILKELEGWNDELESYLENNLVPDLIFIQDKLVEEDFLLFRESTTTYGNFNLNQDSPEKLKKLFEYLELSHSYSESLCETLREYREKEKISNIDELPFEVEGLDLIVFEKLRDYLTIEGRININFVDEDILKGIFRVKELDSEIAEKILAHRTENEIKNIEDLEGIIISEEFAEIEDLFTTNSRYIELCVDAKIPGKNAFEIKTVLERTYQDKKWIINVLSWVESEIYVE